MSTSNKRTGKLRNFFNRITVKQITLIIIFGVVISVASCIIGYIEFSTTIRDTYNKQAYNIAKFVKENIDLTEYEQDMSVLSKNFFEVSNPDFTQISEQPGYKELVKQADYLQKSIEGLDVFIGNYSDSYLEEITRYAVATNDQELLDTLEEENGDIVCSYYRSPDIVPANRKANEPGGLFITSGKEQEALHRLYESKTTQYQDTEIVIEDETNESFNLFSVLEPLLNDSGDIIGFINISIRIGVLQQLLSRYLLLVGFLTILIGVIFILIYIYLNHRMFIDPILSIIKGTSTFVQNNNQITETLNEIKTGDEIQTLAESILKLEKDINAYIKNLAEVTAERERVQTELDLATTIQMSMLPQEIPGISAREEFDIYALMNPAREVGGDFYNYYLIDDDHLGFVVGDVSGKGVPAALFMMIGTILIKTESLPEAAANEIIEKVNDILSENNAEMLFITAWMGIYEISTGTITFVNAGHEPPLLIHENGEIEFVKTKPNLALATFGGIPYQLNSIKLKKGDKIFLYTDGVVEAQNESQEFYNSARLVDVVQASYKGEVKDVVKAIREDIDVFVDGAEQFDDITIFGLEVKEEPENSD